MKFKLVYILFLFYSLFAGNCEMWYQDNNMGKAGYFPTDAKEMFNDTNSWKKALNTMDVYLIRANSLYMKKNGLTHYFIKNKMLKVLKKNHVKFALNVRGATLSNQNKQWKKIRSKEIELIHALEGMGAHIDSINFQSALSKPSKKSKKDKTKFEPIYSMEQRIDDIVSYAKVIHNQFPHIKFGLIDALPTKGYPYKKAYKDLIKRMKKEHLALNHIVLDLPYNFIEEHWRGMTWEKVIEVENFVQNELQLKYGKIYHDAKGGKTSDRLFYNNVMKMATRYKKEGGDPDYCLFMTWYPHPAYTIPETQKYTQMYTFLELAKKVKK